MLSPLSTGADILVIYIEIEAMLSQWAILE